MTPDGGKKEKRKTTNVANSKEEKWACKRDLGRLAPQPARHSVMSESTFAPIDM